MKIYISGPITGQKPTAARFAFESAEREILVKGHDPVNPYKLQSILDPETTTWEQYMRPALALLSVCDAICMLQGWEKSAGANIERATAQENGQLIFYSPNDIRWTETAERGHEWTTD